MSSIFRNILLLILPFIVTNMIFADSDQKANNSTIPYFYKQSTCSNLQNSVNYGLSDKESKDDMLVIFTSMALNEHPECIKIIVDNFNSYTARQKEVYLTALSGLNKIDLVNELSKKYDVQVNNKLIFNPNSVKSMKVNDNTKNMDILWTAYDITGNIIYPKKIAVYLASKDTFLLSISAEMVNRNYICSIAKKMKLSGGCMGYDDLIAAAQKRYLCSKDVAFNMMLPVSTALWSITVNEQQDPELKKKMENLFKNYPQLDYWNRIK